jgi:hypothetical protein
MLGSFIIGLLLIIAAIVLASFISRPRRDAGSQTSNKDADI